MEHNYWLDIVQIILLLLACLACFHRGIESGINLAIQHLVEKGLVDEAELKKFMRSLEK